MRIISVDIPQSEIGYDGLAPIKMDRLNNVVLIAGKNGAGKSRILRKIFEKLPEKPNRSVVAAANAELEGIRSNLDRYKSSLANYEQRFKQDPDMAKVHDLEYSKSMISHEQQRMLLNEKLVNWKEIVTSEEGEIYSAVYFVPKNLELTDSSSYASKQIIALANEIDIVGIDRLPGGTFSKIQVIQDRWFNSTHPLSNSIPELAAKALSDYDRLKDLVHVFLGCSIGRNHDGEATLFGFSMGKSNLSDGQKILLQFCMAVYSQASNLKDLILIMDEPENHLHPSIIIETIERIQACALNGQIWIATHSIPLLAHFDPSLIWYVEDGKISHAGKIPEKVLHSLLGNEEGVVKLQDFISLPSQLATSKYAVDCLFEPKSVITKANDPQSLQIRDRLLALGNSSNIRILDYGAGKGRLISNIRELDEESDDNVISKIDYIAFDKFPNDKEHCENAIKRAFGESDRRYFNDISVLLGEYNKGTFDVVIMCNVLHEIDPKDWLKLFKIKGTLTSLLKDDGVLLLVEDQQIPTGEKAYQKGFLVLDTPQLKELFKVPENDPGFLKFDERKDGRLKAHLINKNLLAQVDEESRLNSIKSMADFSKEKILEMREKEANYQNGKLHGFWTQQFANAELNIAELSST